MQILTIIGTRPEAIKMAPLIKALKKCPNFDSYVCITAQHRGILDDVINLFEIHVDFDLDIMGKSPSLASTLGSMIEKLDNLVRENRPDLILVHGDTCTSLAAGLVGFYNQIDVAHIEAGLRTGNLSAPFPEEFNRRVVALSAKWHFVPTATASSNLLNEGVDISSIYITGNTVIDALHMALTNIDLIDQKSSLFYKKLSVLIGPKWDAEKIILVTGHRRENFGSNIKHICEALIRIAKQYPKFRIIYSVHPNPNIKKPVYELLSNFNNIVLIEPLDYFLFIYLLRSSYIVLTDSGGIQEEAPSLNIPILVMRDSTERQEGIDAGTAILVGSNAESIFEKTSKLIENKILHQKMADAKNPYGDGLSVKRIVDFLTRQYCSK